MAGYTSKEEFFEVICQHFDVTINDSYYDSLSSLGIDKYDFEEMVCKVYGEDKCSSSYDENMCLADVYSNMFS